MPRLLYSSAREGKIKYRQQQYFGSKLNTAYILGLAQTGQSVKILLDIDKVMGSDEISNLNC